MGKHLFKTRTLEMNADLNNRFKTATFTPSGLFYNGKKIVPFKAYGIYFFSSLSFVFGKNGPFCLITLTTITGILFSYLLVRNLLNEKTALLTCFFFGLSFPVIYWSNSVYANMIALTFFIMGFHFFVNIIRDNKHSYLNYILTGLFLSLSIFMRYEYLLFVLLLPLVFFKCFKKLQGKKAIVPFAIFVLFLVCILILNNQFYGSPFSLAYTQQYNLQGQDTNLVINDNISLWEKLRDGIEDIAKRFLMQDLFPNWQRVFKNFNDWIFMTNPLVLILAILGFSVFLFQKNKEKIYLIFLFLIVLFLSYDTCGGYHWGEGEGGVGSVYTRYLLIDFFFLAIFSSHFVFFLKERLNGLKKILPIILLSFLIWNFTLLFVAPSGLKDDVNQKRTFYEINEKVAQLPTNAVIVTGFYGKAIISKDVLNYQNIKRKERDKRESTVRLITDLLMSGYPVYLLESSRHEPTYLNLKNYILRNDTLALIPEPPHQGFSDRLYRIVRKQKNNNNIPVF
jgi:hypothetical protein